MMCALLQFAFGLAYFASLTFGQSTDLFTFQEVRVALERGGTVVLDVDASECESNFPIPDGEHRHISMPLRDWAYGRTEETGAFISVFDFFLEPANVVDFQLALVSRRALFQDDDTVLFFFRERTSDGSTFMVDFTCQLGRSARAFETSKNDIIDYFYDYQEVKAALLLGRHVEAVMFGETCTGTEDWLPSGDAVHYGHRIENFGVFNDATPDESLVFFHSNLVSSAEPEGSNFTVASRSFGYRLYPNGTVDIAVGIFAVPDMVNLWTNPDILCQAGITMQFSSLRYRDASYVTYEAIKEATLKGHDMELIAFTDFCDVVSGDPIPPAIVGHRFSQFQFFEAGDIWGPEEHITYSAFEIVPTGTTIIDEIRVFESNTVIFDWFRWLPDGNKLQGELSCPLSFGALFHAISRERGPDYSYAQIMRAIKNEGALFEIEINYDGCTRGGEPFNGQSIYGSVLWDTYIRENEHGIDEFFAAPVFSATTDGNVGLWNTGLILVNPDNTVRIYARGYDWNGVDVTPFPDPNPIECRLNTGGLVGSVYFFRYP